ncbi:glycosyltransferase [Novosphingobium bradum]|uniref:Glycosyltransferase n=1 Tax=Novosphingobium bradum TaxID=1737444 RepID=A0ABV7IRA4_9SPHN
MRDEPLTPADRAARAASGTILVSAQSHFGGIAEHAHYQAQELARRGFDVVMLCHRDHLLRPTAPLYRRIPGLRRSRRKGFLGRLVAVAAMAFNFWLLAWHMVRLQPRFVLLDAASEYFAPLWAWPHILLHATGRIYLANLHDPVRSRHFGPEWLHRWSLRLIYALLDGGLVHGPVPAEAGLPASLALGLAPLGPFEDTYSHPASPDLRQRFGIPATAPLVLSFGHVADRKNLDLLIEALADFPQVHLLVAGASIGSTQKQVGDYRAQAQRLGLADRVHFDDRFVADADIPSCFAAADLVALTYRSDFVSQSGVLQHAVAFQRPVLVSCGPGPLRATMESFALGELVEPDSVNAIADGLARMLAKPENRAAAFSAYAEASSWRANIDALLRLEEKVRDQRAMPAS